VCPQQTDHEIWHSYRTLASEAKYAQSRADFLHKLTVGLKEANETLYWINLLYDTGYL